MTDEVQFHSYFIQTVAITRNDVREMWRYGRYRGPRERLLLEGEQ